MNYYVFSSDPWDKMLSITKDANPPSPPTAGQPALSWNEFPVLMTQSETKTMDLRLVRPIIKGSLLPPSKGALLQGKLFHIIELVDKLYFKAIKRYQEELLHSSLRDKENLIAEEAAKEKSAIESKSPTKKLEGYLRQAGVHRIAWLKTIEILERERLKNSEEILSSRCEALYSKISPLDEEGLVDIEDIDELKQICKVYCYVFNTNIFFGQKSLREYLKEHDEVTLEEELNEIKHPLNNEIEECLYIDTAASFHPAINPAETKAPINEEVGISHEMALLRQKAEKGDEISMYNLGWCFLNGFDLQHNPQEAMRWFVRASEKNVVQAVYSVGLLYDSRMKLDVFANDDEAFLWYDRAAQNGFAPAQYMVGHFYQNGIAVNKDLKLACKWYTKAMQQNDKNAQYALGCINDEKEGEWRKSFRLFLGAANQGHPQAQEKVGKCYKQGEGVIRDEKEGLKWAAKATKKYNEDKQKQNKSLIFMEAHQCQQILILNQEDIASPAAPPQAINQEAIQAQSESSYKEGSNFYKSKDYAAAFQAFNVAAQNGHTQAKYWLGLCYYEGKGVGQDEKKGVQCFFEAADQNDIDAQLMIGDIYRLGQGRVIAKSLRQCYYIYNKASKAGNRKAMLGLADYYFDAEYWSHGKERMLKEESKEYIAWLKTTPNASHDAAVIHRIGRHYAIDVCWYTDGNGMVEGEKYLKQAAEMGYAPAQFDLGMLYGRAHLPVAYSFYDYKKATKFLQLSIEQGERENLTADQISKAKAKIDYVNSWCIIS